MFGSFLFFKAEAGHTSLDGELYYAIELAESELIEASSLFYHDDYAKLDAIVEQVMALCSVDRDTAEELLSERQHAQDVVAADLAADVSWQIQKLTAECAKILGYRGAIVSDEYGCSYMIDMLDRVGDLQRLDSKPLSHRP
jgi:hypothetical protein